ncbi:DUF664 domain-containing protein [bacterium]|nr:DUF664 domain-containing protein [bacterium]
MSDMREIRLNPDPDLHPRLALLLAQMEDVRGDLKTQAERWEDEELDLAVVPGFLSPGELLLHIAEAEAWWLRIVLAGQGEGDPPRLSAEALIPFLQDEEGEPEAGERPLVDYLAVLDDTRAWTRDHLAGLEAADLAKEFPFTDRKGQDYRFSMAWILHHLVEHEAHHRGQLALMRRLLDTLRELPAAD